MKVPFPHMRQAANNLTNGSREAIDAVDKWVDSKGGSVEHLSYEQVTTKVKHVLEEAWEKRSGR